jgi:hypothetical protein
MFCGKEIQQGKCTSTSGHIKQVVTHKVDATIQEGDNMIQFEVETSALLNNV